MSLPAEKPAVQSTVPSTAPRRAGSLNLSSRPFVNTRPVTRVSILLWVLGLLLLLGNISLFWSYRSGSAEKLTELERLDQEIQRQNQTVTQLRQRLDTIDLTQQNRQVLYLNRKIAERTFSWSLLFDRIAAVLPDDVRVTRLAPRTLRKTTGRPDDELDPLDDRVLLVIHGVSRSDEAVDDFVDRLFAHESFDDPDITRVARENEGDDTVEFDLRVTYNPGPPLAQGVVIEEEAPAPAIVEEAPAVAPSAAAAGAGTDR